MCSVHTEIVDQKNCLSPPDMVLQTLKELFKSIGVYAVVLNVPCDHLSAGVYCSCYCYCFEAYLLFRYENWLFLR